MPSAELPLIAPASPIISPAGKSTSGANIFEPDSSAIAGMIQWQHKRTVVLTKQKES